MEFDRRHTIRESSHRILNPFTAEKLATLGAALHLPPGARLLDLACGKGELLCTWPATTGSPVPGWTSARCSWAPHEHGRPSWASPGSSGSSTPTPRRTGHRSPWTSPAASARRGSGTASPAPWACSGRACGPAVWSSSGSPSGAGTHPIRPPVAELAPLHASELGWLTLPGLVAQVQGLGWDVVEMVLADEDSWDH